MPNNIRQRAEPDFRRQEVLGSEVLGSNASLSFNELSQGEISHSTIDDGGNLSQLEPTFSMSSPRINLSEASEINSISSGRHEVDVSSIDAHAHANQHPNDIRVQFGRLFRLRRLFRQNHHHQLSAWHINDVLTRLNPSFIGAHQRQEQETIIRFDLGRSRESRVHLFDRSFLLSLSTGDLSRRTILDINNINIVSCHTVDNLFRYTISDNFISSPSSIFFRTGDFESSVRLLSDEELALRGDMVRSEDLSLLPRALNDILTRNGASNRALLSAVNRAAIHIATHIIGVTDQLAVDHLTEDVSAIFEEFNIARGPLRAVEGVISDFYISNYWGGNQLEGQQQLRRETQHMMGTFYNPSEGVHILNDFQFSDESIDEVLITLSRDAVFDGLTAHSLLDPGGEFRVAFQEEAGVDLGGLTKEALTLSYNQIVDLKLINNEFLDHYTLSTLSAVSSASSDSSTARKEVVQQFIKLGHLLAISANMSDFKTDLPIGKAVFDQIHGLRPYVRLSKKRVIPLLKYLLESIHDDDKANSIVQSLSGSEKNRKSLIHFFEAIGQGTQAQALKNIQAQELHGMEITDDSDEFSSITVLKNKFWTSEQCEKMPANTLYVANLFIVKLMQMSGLLESDLVSADDLSSFGHELIQGLGEVITPSLAVATGFEAVNGAQDDGMGGCRYASGAELQSQIMNSASLKDKLEQFKGEESDFFNQYFTINIRVEDLTKPEELELKNNLQKCAMQMISQETSEHLKMFMQFVTASRVLPCGETIILDVQPIPVGQDAQVVRLPTAHTCYNTVDIPVELINTQEKVSLNIFQAKMSYAVKNTASFGVV